MTDQRSYTSFLRAYWPAVLWGMFILYATLTPGKSLPSVSLFRFDKLIHLVIFGTFAWLILRGLYQRTSYSTVLSKGILYAFVSICTISFGIAIEGMQNYIPDRGADVYDVIANTTGILLAQILFFIVHRNKPVV